MDYKEALDIAIDAVRQGKSLDTVMLAFPEHAVALREDLQLTNALQAYARKVSQPPADARVRALQRMHGELATQRSERETARASKAPRRFPLLQGLAFAVVAIFAIGLVAVAAGVFSNAQTAEAETIDGVVVQSTAQGIVLQTESGLQTISLDEASTITDESGGNLEAASIEAGQVIVLRVKRVAAGQLKAVTVQTRAAGALREWCRLHPLRCQEVEPKLPAESLSCQSEAACVSPAPSRPIPSATPATGASRPATASTVVPTPSSRPGVASSSPAAAPTAVVQRGRLVELSERCQQTGGAACEELRSFCRATPALCVVLTGWLRSLVDLPDNAGERVRLQTQRCQAGSILDCRELRLFCERTNQACPALNTPAPAQTPRRNDRRF